MSTAIHTCIEFQCDGCDEGWADDEGTPHFSVPANPSDQHVEAATAEFVKGYGWTSVDGEHFCRNCSAERLCAAKGHDWGRWRESFNYGDPNWRTKPHTHEERFCERDYCHERETREHTFSPAGGEDRG